MNDTMTSKFQGGDKILRLLSLVEQVEERQNINNAISFAHMLNTDWKGEVMTNILSIYDPELAQGLATMLNLNNYAYSDGGTEIMSSISDIVNQEYIKYQVAQQIAGFENWTNAAYLEFTALDDRTWRSVQLRCNVIGWIDFDYYQTSMGSDIQEAAAMTVGIEMYDAANAEWTMLWTGPCPVTFQMNGLYARWQIKIQLPFYTLATTEPQIIDDGNSLMDAEGVTVTVNHIIVPGDQNGDPATVTNGSEVIAQDIVNQQYVTYLICTREVINTRSYVIVGGVANPLRFRLWGHLVGGIATPAYLNVQALIPPKGFSTVSGMINSDVERIKIEQSRMAQQIARITTAVQDLIDAWNGLSAEQQEANKNSTAITAISSTAGIVGGIAMASTPCLPLAIGLGIVAGILTVIGSIWSGITGASQTKTALAVVGQLVSFAGLGAIIGYSRNLSALSLKTDTWAMTKLDSLNTQLSEGKYRLDGENVLSEIQYRIRPLKGDLDVGRVTSTALEKLSNSYNYLVKWNTSAVEAFSTFSDIQLFHAITEYISMQPQTGVLSRSVYTRGQVAEILDRDSRGRRPLLPSDGDSYAARIRLIFGYDSDAVTFNQLQRQRLTNDIDGYSTGTDEFREANIGTNNVSNWALDVSGMASDVAWATAVRWAKFTSESTWTTISSKTPAINEEGFRALQDTASLWPKYSVALNNCQYLARESFNFATTGRPTAQMQRNPLLTGRLVGRWMDRMETNWSTSGTSLTADERSSLESLFTGVESMVEIR